MYLQNTYMKDKFLASAILYGHVASKALQEKESDLEFSTLK